MSIPKGWHVLYRPKYGCPSIFDLNERGLFRNKPKITRDFGACLIIDPEKQIKAYYAYLAEGGGEQGGTRYDYQVMDGVASLDEDLKLDSDELSKISSQDMVREIEKVHEEWFQAFVPADSDGKIDKKNLAAKLDAALEDRKKAHREYLVRKNGKWIYPYLPRLAHEFKRVVYPLVWDSLYDEYKKRGGENSENDLIQKISIFDRIYGSDPEQELEKPEGDKWSDENEMWDCWVGGAKSEAEAKRICATLETVLRDARSNLSAD